MRLEAFKASKGDSFMLSWIYGNKKCQILIDGGIANTYKFIKQYIKKEPYLNGLIITHVDYDHIGGIFRLINDPDLPVSLDFTIYINTPELILHPPQDGMVAIDHGVEFSKILDLKKIIKKPMYAGMETNNIIQLSGLIITILSPTLEILEKLKVEWTANALYKKYLEENEVDGKISIYHEDFKSYSKILEEKEEIPTWDSDLINSSSIAFLSEFNNKRILFLADSNPNVIADQLEIKFSKINRLKVDLVKISHHGSRFNISRRLLELLDTDSYLISTNGAGPYYHPHREAIVRIVEYGRQDKNKSLNIYTNYELEKERFITAEEESAWKIKIIKKNEFEF